jgi:hypothetical protein
LLSVWDLRVLKEFVARSYQMQPFVCVMWVRTLSRLEFGVKDARIIGAGGAFADWACGCRPYDNSITWWISSASDSGVVVFGITKTDKLHMLCSTWSNSIIWQQLVL